MTTKELNIIGWFFLLAGFLFILISKAIWGICSLIATIIFAVSFYMTHKAEFREKKRIIDERLKEQKRINDLKMTPHEKQVIDKMTYEQMVDMWNYNENKEPTEEQETECYFKKVMQEKSKLQTTKP